MSGIYRSHKVIVVLIILVVVLLCAYNIAFHRVEYVLAQRLYENANVIDRGCFANIRDKQHWHEMTNEIIAAELGQTITFGSLELPSGTTLKMGIRVLEKDHYSNYNYVNDVLPAGPGPVETVWLTISSWDSEGRRTDRIEKVSLVGERGRLWTEVEFPLAAEGNIIRLQVNANSDVKGNKRYVYELVRPEVEYNVVRTVRSFKKRRHVIIVTLDTTRADYLGCYGNDYVKTPNIDGFAADSVVFQNGISAANCTRPAHASIFSSLYLKDHNVTSNKVNLPDDPRILAKQFRSAGYGTAAFVSSVVFNGEASGFTQGFDKFEYYDGNLKRPAEDTNYFVLNWLNENFDKNFFLWVHYFDPHKPYIPPYPYNVMYDRDGPTSKRPFSELSVGRKDYFELSDKAEFYRNLYRGEISYLDSQLGRLFDRLKELGVYDDCLIVVIGDHGESLGEHEIYFSHEGLYEEVVRVPYIIKLSGNRHKGVRRGLVSSVDIYPTVMELEGMEPGFPIRGKSLTGILNNPDDDTFRDVAFFEYCNSAQVGARTSEYKYIQSRVDAALPTMPGYKFSIGKTELYNILTDRDELNNITGDEPQVATALEKKTAEYLRDSIPLKTTETTDKDYIKKLKTLGYVQ